MLKIQNWLLKILGCKCEEKNIEINSLKYQIEELKKQTNLTEPSKLGTISLNNMYVLLTQHTTNIFLSDEFYNLTSKEEAEKFSKETKVQYDTWVADNHDCDNFSFALMGYWSRGLYSFAFGIGWSKTHAFNIMIDNNKQIWIVEPQTNQYFKIEDVINNKLYYPLRLILI
jgi:hypothetical protein